MQLVPCLRDLCGEPARQGIKGHDALAVTIRDAFTGDWSRASEIIAQIHGRLAGLETWTKDGVKSCLAYALTIIKRCAHQYHSIEVTVEIHLDGAGIDTPRGGSADIIVRCYSQAGRRLRSIVIDHKLGFVSQGDAADHLQLGGYSVMEWDASLPIDGVEVHLSAGRRHEFTCANYDEAAIAGVRARIKRLVAAARAPAPPLRPSLKACKYCKALLFCRATREFIMDASESASLFGFQPEDRLRLADAAALAKRFAQAYDDFVKHLRAMEADAASRRNSSPARDA